MFALSLMTKCDVLLMLMLFLLVMSTELPRSFAEALLINSPVSVT